MKALAILVMLSSCAHFAPRRCDDSDAIIAYAGCIRDGAHDGYCRKVASRLSCGAFP